MVAPPLSEVGLLDRRVRTTSLRRALGDERPKFIANDVVAGVDHHLHVVLDEQLGQALGAQFLQQLGDLRAARSGSCRPSARRAAAGAGSGRQRAGDLDPPLRAVGQLGRAQAFRTSLEPGAARSPRRPRPRAGRAAQPGPRQRVPGVGRRRRRRAGCSAARSGRAAAARSGRCGPPAAGPAVAGGTLWYSSPSRSRSPRVSGVSRVIAPSRVLFPEPLGPRIP